MRKWQWWPWIGAGAVLAVSAAVLFIIHSSQKYRLLTAASQLDHRPLEMRLSGFPYAPLHISRGTNDPASPALLRLHGVAGEILAQPSVSSAPDSLHTRAIAALLAGNTAEAVDLLERATTLLPSDPTLWTDLAAARTTHAESAYDYAQALASADRAIQIAAKSEALFNRAIILERLGLRQAASRAWQRYLITDSTSAWAGEVRERLAGQATPNERDLWSRDMPRLRWAATTGELESVRQLVRRYPQQARSWSEMQFLADWAKARSAGNLAAADTELKICRSIGSALQDLSGERLLADAVVSIDRAQGDNVRKIAQAHIDYLNARLLYHQRQPAKSLPKFEEAASLFSSQHSPMALLCSYYRSSVLFDRNDNRGAAILVDRLTEEVPAEYLALRAQVIWNRGTISANDGAFDAARSSYAAALILFERLGELDNALMMRSALVSVLSRLGQGAEAWNARRDAFEQVSSSGNTTAQFFVLSAAMDDEIAQQHWPVASSIARIVMEEEPENPRIRFLAFRCRAYADLRMKDDGFASDLKAARYAAVSIRDIGLREAALDELQFVEAIDAAQRNPRLALALLGNNMAFAKTHHGFTIPAILLTRARALQQLGSTQQSIDALRASIDTIEQRRAIVSSEDLRDTFLGTSDEAYRDLIDILATRGDAIAALEIAERFRGRTILELTAHSEPERQPILPADLLRRVPHDSLIVEYVTLPNRLIILVIDHNVVQLKQIDVSREQLRSLAQTYLSSTAANHESENRASSLYELLISPLEPTLSRYVQLAIVPDEELRNVPFAALWNRSRSMRLVEEIAVAVVPSASTFARACEAVPTRAERRLLAAGAAPIDSHTFPELNDLPNARPELNEVAQFYLKGVVLTGSNATKHRFIQELPRSDFVHVATHAVTRASGIAALVLAADAAGDEVLDSREIAMLRLPRRPVVVLAGCRTAFAGTSGSDLSRLSDAFLAAGATSVIASLWNVDDAAARKFSVRIHDEMRNGATPAIALQIVQLKMMRESDATTKSWQTWSAFEVYGSGL